MKNTKHKLLIAICCIIFLGKPAYCQQLIQVFGEPLSIDGTLKKGAFPAGYPLSVDATAIRHCIAYGISQADIQELYNTVADSADQTGDPAGTPVLCSFFTSAYDDDSLSIVRATTHGFCFGFHADSTLRVYYYEKRPDGNFTRVDHLTMEISELSYEFYVSLHYSHFEPGSYPDKSTLFTFISNAPGYVKPTENDFITPLSRDLKRQTGLYVLGMSDSLVLTAIDKPNTEEKICQPPCPPEPNKCCMSVYDEWGLLYTQCMQCLGRGCAAGAASKAAQNNGLDLGVEIKLKSMRAFRDNVMRNTCEGRKYIGYYYQFSKYAKMDVAMLWKYAAALPELYDAMDNFSDSTKNSVVITTSLKEKVMAIIDDHRDVGDAYFQSILNEVAQDLETYREIPRSILISMLTPYGTCAGQRNAFQEGGVSDPFVSVSNNSSTNEITVRYSVSGGTTKFELFNAGGVRVVLISDAPETGKLTLSSAKLEPGIYLYRLTSGSGYTTAGKVSILN